MLSCKLPSTVIVTELKCLMFIVFVQTEVRITDADLHPMFVQVALLQKGDIFVRTQHVSLSLISDISHVFHVKFRAVHT